MFREDSLPVGRLPVPTGPSPVIVTNSQLRLSYGGQTEAAYRRSDLFERRRILMNDWARYLA